MSKRSLALLAVIAATVALISVFFLDQRIAIAVHNSGFERAVIVVRVREFFDYFIARGLINSFAWGQLALGALLVVIGVIWLIARRTSRNARGLIFTGAAQLATIETVSLIKDLFGRARPFQLIERNDWTHIWFVGGSSFPSGHNAFFWGLFLPLAYLCPKYRIPLLIIPTFIAFARIDESYHFLSDVLGAIAIAALVTLIGAVLFDRWVRPVSSKS
jgi:membrane-associated phospholipid phosphatase